MFSWEYWEICKSRFFNKARLVAASEEPRMLKSSLIFLEEPMTFSIYLKNRLLPNMFASWLPQIVTFLSWLLKSGLVMLFAIFQKLPLCQLQTVHLVDSLKIGERRSESNTSYVVWSIRKNYSSENCFYKDFKQAEND